MKKKTEGNKKIKKRLKELSNLIKIHNHHYHTKDQPLITDW